MKSSIEKLDEYVDIMNQIERLVQKGSKMGGMEKLLESELNEFESLSILANNFEKKIRDINLTQPKTLSEAIKIKMMHLRIKQKEMATLLEITESRLSEILNGKRRVNMDLAKKLYSILKIEADFILQTA